MGVGAREGSRVIDASDKFVPFGARSESNRSWDRWSQNRTHVALRIEEDHHLLGAGCVDRVRDVRGREHAGGHRPTAVLRDADPKFTVDGQHELHRVMRMPSHAQAWTTRGKQRWPSLDVQPSGKVRKCHAGILAVGEPETASSFKTRRASGATTGFSRWRCNDEIH